MVWIVFEQGERRQHGEFETREEAERCVAALVSEDPAYADVLYVLSSGEKPELHAPPVPGAWKPH